jgi:hypothetical protein
MRKLALRVLIGSIALSALTGIYVLVFGGDGEIEGKVFVTSLSISGLSILVMACGVALERGKLGFVPHGGTVTAVAGFIVLMILIWELGEHRVWAQSALTLITASAAAALASLLSLADLAPRFRWVRVLGFLSDAALATTLILFIWEILDPENDALGRMTGVFAILLGAATVAVPILYRMSGPDEPLADRAKVGRPGTVNHCVVCGQGLAGSPDTEITCSRCGARFRIEFSEK